jgi:8-amino-7-oxononanoate synthase
MWRRLFERGIFTSPIFHPAVPQGTALIRTSCMATHTTAQLERVLEAFEREKGDGGIIY